MTQITSQMFAAAIALVLTAVSFQQTVTVPLAAADNVIAPTTLA